MQHTVGKILTRAITLLQTLLQLEVWKRSYRPPKSWESQLWEFWDSHFEVLGQNVIWMWPPWRDVEDTIKGKVVASPKSKPWWVLWVRGYMWFVLAPKVFKLFTNQCVVWFVQIHVNDWTLFILPSPISEFQHAPLPLEVLRTRERTRTPCSFTVFTSDSHLSLLRSLGACQSCSYWSI
jgi:hypothetical protein